MGDDLQGILKAGALKQFQDKPTYELAGAPLSVLSFLTAAQAKKLNAAGIAAVGDLAMVKDLSALVVKVDPGIIQRIVCLLSYPQHDPGPNCAWEQLFQSAPLSYYISLNKLHTHFGPVFYRGRLDGSARLLVIGQDPATDETVGGRAFVGQAGQIAQNFLTRLGLTRSYLMFNTFLFGVQSSALTPAIATDATIMAFRNKLLDYAKSTNTFTAILAFGQYAQISASNWPGSAGIPIIPVSHPTAQSGVAANWNSHFAAAHAAIAADSDGHVDATPYSTTTALPATDIPRRDLPFGLPSWHGTGGGTRSQRASGSAFETQINWTAP
jgi:uracil-DNA glycosylase